MANPSESTITPLAMAIIQHDPLLVDQLISNGVDIHETDDMAFCVAVLMNDEPAARLLLELGANVNAIPNNQLSRYSMSHSMAIFPLHYEASFGHEIYGAPDHGYSLKGFLLYSSITIHSICNNPMLDLLMEYDIDVTDSIGGTIFSICLSRNLSPVEIDSFLKIIHDLLQTGKLNQHNIGLLLSRNFTYNHIWKELECLLEKHIDESIIDHVLKSIIHKIILDTGFRYHTDCFDALQYWLKKWCPPNFMFLPEHQRSFMRLLEQISREYCNENYQIIELFTERGVDIKPYAMMFAIQAIYRRDDKLLRTVCKYVDREEIVDELSRTIQQKLQQTS